MSYFGILLAAFSLGGAVVLWSLGIRGYLLKKGHGRQSAANLFVAMWVDWQVCRDLANASADSTGQALCFRFVVLHGLAAAGLLLLFL